MKTKSKKKSLIDKPKELLELIDDCLKPKIEEKKKFGEVFTPFKLINEMLDKLDEYYRKSHKEKSIFSVKKFKWFDPANGMGNFPIAVYLRLMEGLKNKIKNKEKRKKHILEKMLYMSELNKKNVFICKQIFDVENKYNLNLYCGDSLELNTIKQWNIEKFDVIIGNPPYQDGSGNRGKGHTLWTKFVEKFINKINEKKYMSFIHPSLWRQAEHPLLDVIKSKQILYLEIHDEKDGQKTFRCSTRYDWYILQNTKYKKKTKILGQDCKTYTVDLTTLNFIPNDSFILLKKLIDSKIKVEILHSRSDYGTDKKWTDKIEDSVFKYPCVYSVNRKNIPTFRWSNTNKNGMFGIPKVIWGGGATGFIVDKKGKYGLTEWCSGITDDVENLENIKKCLDSEKFKIVIKATSVSKAEINIKILKHFKKDFWKEFIEN
jgi:hypothetical protein